MISETNGMEPILSVQIDWGSGGSTLTYTGQDKLINVSTIQQSTKIKTLGTTGNVNITIDDSDAAIIGLLETVDIHKIACRVYLEDNLIFSGVLTSNISWNENPRSINISASSIIEDNEIGYSLEQADV